MYVILSHMDDNYMIGYCSMSRIQAKEKLSTSLKGKKFIEKDLISPSNLCMYWPWKITKNEHPPNINKHNYFLIYSFIHKWMNKSYSGHSLLCLVDLRGSKSGNFKNSCNCACSSYMKMDKLQQMNSESAVVCVYQLLLLDLTLNKYCIYIVIDISLLWLE